MFAPARTPEFSVIMPCYNAAATLNDTIASLLAQTRSTWELICIDDGSTDETPLLLAGWEKADPRITAFTNTQKGPSAARNLGASRARGEILCFLDADDLWTADKLASLHRAYRDAAIDGAFGRIAFFRHRARADTYSTVPRTPLTIPMLLGENPVCTMSNISVRRTAWHRSGGLNTDLVHNEDLDWLIRLTGEGAVIQPLQQLHVWYRTSPSGLSSDLPAMARSRRQVLATARRFGFEPDARAEAIYLRYLARRALRLDHLGVAALRLTFSGLRHSPRAFLFPLHRGLMTALAALCAPLLPRPIRRSLFSR